MGGKEWDVRGELWGGGIDRRGSERRGVVRVEMDDGMTSGVIFVQRSRCRVGNDLGEVDRRKDCVWVKWNEWEQ